MATQSSASARKSGIVMSIVKDFVKFLAFYFIAGMLLVVALNKIAATFAPGMIEQGLIVVVSDWRVYIEVGFWVSLIGLSITFADKGRKVLSSSTEK
jgi:hypothetical protein